MQTDEKKQYKAAVFDIDGTLIPVGDSEPSARTLAALRALQAGGVVVIIATGRALFAAQSIAGCATPDYYVAACGNVIADANGRCLEQNVFSTEEMYAIVDFFEDYELPMAFAFDDAYYTYVEHDKMIAYYEPFEDSLQFLKNGEDQVRHLQSMPSGASGVITPEQAALFGQKYGHLGLRFLPFGENTCDIVRPGTDKAAALTRLLARLGIGWDETAAFGDGANDLEMLGMAGLAVAMGNASPVLQEIADVVAPCAAEDGVAQVVERLLLA